MARAFVPRAAVRAQPLQHLEVPAQSRRRARVPVPRPAVRAQHLQLFELSAPRRCLTKEFLTRQATLPLQALHCAYTSELHGTLFIKLLKPKPRFCHQVAHRAAHRWEPCEIGGIVECSDLRMCVTTRWLGRRRKASPAFAVLAALASRSSFFFSRARDFLPAIALKQWVVLCPRRASRCISVRGFRERAFTNKFRPIKIPAGDEESSQKTKANHPFRY